MCVIYMYTIVHSQMHIHTHISTHTYITHIYRHLCMYRIYGIYLHAHIQYKEKDTKIHVYCLLYVNMPCIHKYIYICCICIYIYIFKPCDFKYVLCYMYITAYITLHICIISIYLYIIYIHIFRYIQTRIYIYLCV